MTDATQLAVLGGTPAIAEPLHVGRPNIGDREEFAGYVADILDRRWLTNDGECVRQLESRLAELLGVTHCIAINNGTVALQVMAKALGLEGEVIMPSFTFVATAHALEWQGVRPVFCDIDPLTHNIDPRSVESLIKDETTGILGVHVWGRPCDVESLRDIADRHGLVLAFDAAHALACSHGGTMIGNFGSAECFSFHATKFFNTFEGGAITTNDDEVAAKCRLLRNFGFAGADNVVSLGINGKMSEVSAAMGLTNLGALPSFIETNRAHHARYREGLAGIPGIELALFDENELSNYQYVVIEVDESIAGLSRDDLRRVLSAENVLARRYFYPGCHRMPPYKDRPLPQSLQQTERLTTRALSLPTGTGIRAEEVPVVCAVIRAAVGQAEEVKASLDAAR